MTTSHSSVSLACPIGAVRAAYDVLLGIVEEDADAVEIELALNAVANMEQACSQIGGLGHRFPGPHHALEHDRRRCCAIMPFCVAPSRHQIRDNSRKHIHCIQRGAQQIIAREQHGLDEYARWDCLAADDAPGHISTDHVAHLRAAFDAPLPAACPA